MSEDKSTKKPGKVYLVGAGPGDPGLITVRGRELLGRAEVLVYDHLASKKLLRFVPATAELIYAGKKGNVHHAFTQAEINRMLVDHAKAGRLVVRLKGGDPFIFGRGGEEIQELVAEGVAFEVVPGVTSASAAATYAGIPITHRDFTSSVAFITGHEDPTRKDSRIAWDKISTGIGTLVFYMGIKNLPSISENLIKHGRAPETPVAVIRWASTPDQFSVVGTLANIAARVKEVNLTPPALVVVGEVVSLRDTINWFEKKPLFGKKILVTRTRDQASELVSRLEEEGAECLEGSTISLVEPESWSELDAAMEKVGEFDWLLFTSINAITFFFRRLAQLDMDVRDLKGPKIAAVGTATAEALRKYGIRADLLPREFTGEGLADALLQVGVKGKRIFLPRALVAKETLVEKLNDGGGSVTVAPVYRNVRPDSYKEVLMALEKKKIDMVTFTSSSTVSNFLEMLQLRDQADFDRLLGDVKIAVIGPVTAKTATRMGMKIDIQPETYTIPALVEAIVDYYGK